MLIKKYKKIKSLHHRSCRSFALWSPKSVYKGPRFCTHPMARRQGIFWLLTIPYHEFGPPYLPPQLAQLRGQLEQGTTTAYVHWQLVATFKAKVSLRGVKAVFGDSCHGELSRSSAANAYCWKEESSIPGTRFELGSFSFNHSSKTDWELVWTAAKSGDFEKVPPHCRVVNYGALRRISSDYSRSVGMERQCFCFWGTTGTGKSRRAWDEAGMDAYCKDPRTKFWCGYQMEKNVVIDEFRGGIDIAHLLRWLDRYPVRVEIKGSSVPLVAEKVWITSNLEPRYWYPDCDQATVDALMRRLVVTEFPENNLNAL